MDKRCNYHTDDVASPHIIESSKRLLDRLFPIALPTIDWDNELFSEWNSKFAPEKQARMLSQVERFSEASLSEYRNKQVFTKVEALLKRHDPSWAPRVIYKGSDIYNCLTGPLVEVLITRLNQALLNVEPDGIRYKLGYKTVSPDICSFFDTMEQPGHFLECDFSSNDKMQCSSVNYLMRLWYKRLGAPSWFTLLYAKTNTFKAYSVKHSLSMDIEHQLATGACDTTLRNSIWNMTIFHSFALRYGQSGRVCILGDDMLACLTTKLPHGAAGKYADVADEARMKAKAKVFLLLQQCSFLSKSFVPNSAGHSMMPLLGKALARFNARANNNLAVSDLKYMAGKSLSYAYEFRFFDGLRDLFLHRFLLTGVTSGDLDWDDLSWNARQAGLTISNIKSKLIEPPEKLVDDFHLSDFLYCRYGLVLSDMLPLIERVILEPKGDDVSGPVAEAFLMDFV